MNEIPKPEILKPSVPAPDIIRCAAMDLVVTDLAASRAFYVDVLGLHVTEEDDEAIYLRSFEEFIHHNLVLRKGPVAAVAAFAYRVRTPEDARLVTVAPRNRATEAASDEVSMATMVKVLGLVEIVGIPHFNPVRRPARPFARM